MVGSQGVSTDGGRTWQFIAEDLPPAATSFDWQLPPSAGLSDVRVRVMASDPHFQTSTDGGQITFSVSQGSSVCGTPPGEVGDVGVDGNKVTVQWSPLPGNATFHVARGGLNGLAAGTPASCMTWGSP
ncbi:MAG: hypothetical protein OEV00_03620 [Acidobacteriota bacterium]|nr:hypothetical protein [Acidobacteriota bacterium]MDH3784399.1 hypothetical protein [Acidobacteriota bacterium]